MKTVLLCLALAFGATLAHAEDAISYKVGALQITQPWSRATPKGAQVAGAYFKITNTGTTPDRLVGGSSPVAGRFEIHEMSMDNGVMKMRPVPNGLEIKPGESVELKPGAFHVMMLDLKQPLNKGDHVKATLKFEKAGPVDIEYNVVGVGETPAAAAPGPAGGGMHDMKGMKGM
ncbi:MAG: copper chaperone PCu(A)C [Xanthobacteraceae bacterium]|nr:copper chaperone PCu(A)C [Xanthobacteraceae bacterium]MBV9632785.1 copper chaperone PCu(A)C [Xanthobacteraceae bacterium]